MSPNTMLLQEAVREIVGASKPRSWQTNAAQPSRFFFVVGAGISYPSIPLAAGFEDLCRKEIEREGHKLPAVSASRMERYETYFRTAFPQPEDRRAFLHEQIQKAPISAANFRLAHLVSSGKLTNLVVTTNFDELLTKALRLFGMDVIVCDHPKTTQRIDPKRNDIQVVHVHGTHWFYDCCNLKEEIKDRAKADGEDTSNMGQLLDRILFDRSPLVVGYSGWEEDVVMAALKRRLRTSLGYNLYWFCFRRADMDDLPRWLKEHGNIRFVVPEEVKGAGSVTVGGALRAAAPPLSTAGDSEHQEAVLPAQQVFDAMIRGLGLSGPPLTKDPLNFFAEQLRKNLGVSDMSVEDNIYFLHQVVRRVEDGAKLVQKEIERRPLEAKKVSALLERVRESVRSADYAAAINAAREIDLESLARLVDMQYVDEFDAVLENIYLGVVGFDPQLGFDACELRARLCGIVQASGSKREEWLLREAKAMHGKGYSLGVLGRNVEALATYNEIVRRFGDAENLALKERVARALFNKALELEQQGENSDAIAVYDEIFQRFSVVPERFFQVQVGMALINKGGALWRQGKYSEVIVTCDEVLRLFDNGTEPLLREKVARALYAKGAILEQQGRSSEAIAAYEGIFLRFGDATEPALREKVAKALVNKGVVLGQQGKSSEKIAACDEVLLRFGDATEPALREQVAKALVNKSAVLGQQGSNAETIAACDEVLRRFGDATEPVLREQVANALVNKGLALRQQGKSSEEIIIYDEILRRFGNATEPALKQLVAEVDSSKSIALKAGNRP